MLTHVTGRVLAVSEHSWMMFVDGENFTLRGQQLAQSNGVELVEGPWFRKDCFLWVPTWRAGQRYGAAYPVIHDWAVRASYYTTVQGDDPAVQQVANSLWALGFNPCVFKKEKTKKAKGVDIALTKDVLSHGFLGNYQSAVLVAGDGDYVPLVEEVKHLGKRVIVWFFGSEGLSPELRVRCDDFIDLTHPFLDHWKSDASGQVPRKANG